MASSGITAALLEVGQTAHSTFKCPLKIFTDYVSSICNISKQSNAGKLMKDCSLQILDEASISHKASVEGLDRAMRDLSNSNCPVGGCAILFSGDFSQILPDITMETRADEVNASLKSSYLWPHITKCELKTNIRNVSSSKDNRQFSIDLLLIGNGVNAFITLINLCVW